jgi:hypothetical protein
MVQDRDILILTHTIDVSKGVFWGKEIVEPQASGGTCLEK